MPGVAAEIADPDGARMPRHSGTAQLDSRHDSHRKGALPVVSNTPTLQGKAGRTLQRAHDWIDRIEAEGRDPTASEYAQIDELIDQARTQAEFDRKMHEVGVEIGAPPASFDFAPLALDPGSRFVNSEGFKAVQDPARRSQSWSTGLIEITGPPQHWQTKGTLLEGSSSPGSGSGGGLLPVPQVAPGMIGTVFQPLVLEQLLSANVATGNTVRYIFEGTATSGAGGVAEGGTKPESTLGLATKDEPVKKIATLLPLSDEILEDAPSVQNYVNNRMLLFINIEVERELLRGTSGGNEVQGLLTSRGVPVYNGGTADNKAVQMFKAMNSMRGSALLEPEWVVMHPTDYQIVRLLTDTAGQFFGGGPFLGAYNGQGGQVAASSQLAGVVDTLWGKPCYVTASVGGPGTALVGTQASACVWSRGGARVEISNSHANDFAQDLVRIRCERRLGFTVYRPSGFVEVHLAVGPGG
jgi:HK97 family phage major capsid protein